MDEINHIRGRFAPTNSGRMHLGNVFTALLAWLDVRSLGGELLLRLEDLDRDRCKDTYAQILKDDLTFLGLDWDMGWEKSEGEFAQSRRGEVYEKHLNILADKGLLYPCYCSRKERMSANAPHQSDGSFVYSGRCRNLSFGEKLAFENEGRKPAFRLVAPSGEVSFEDDNFGTYRENVAKDCGDFILRRSDGVFAYQLAVVVDDALMGVTRVVRGRDLLSSTPRQIYLGKMLGFAIPSYAHCPLLTDKFGRRLSKRDGDLDMGALRNYATAEEIVGFLAYTAGLTEKMEKLSAKELISAFSWEKIGCADKIVEPDALKKLLT